MNHRHLTADEIELLRRQGNSADDWTQVLVADPFCPGCLRGNLFEGTVTLGAIERRSSNDDLPLREGIYGSTLRDVSIGNHPAIHNVRLLCRYALGDNVTLLNIDEMTCSADPHSVGWLEPMNENGGRRILPFPGMTIADAYLWARYRGRKRLMQRLEEFTFSTLASEEGRFGQVGDNAVVKNTRTLRNVALRSSADDPTVVDSCIALCDGVVGLGCRIAFGVIASRFLLGEHVCLEFGLRLNDSVVGDNSTLARCEVGNSFLFPAHEQHHNNSFLIAALVMGQSNIAAGGTIGSNHNSRTADNELAAGRGFWPGLCCSFKHSSRFASYCLLAKADYPAELDIKLPFSLVNNNVALDRLEVMPAYWWMYNMYAMDRNSRKFARRDRRVAKSQHIEFAPLAPDTAEEILAAMALLQRWMAAADGDEVRADGMEKSRRPTVILKAREGLRAYEDMLVCYAVQCLEAHGWPSAASVAAHRWVNLGGQLMPDADAEQLIADIESGRLDNWDAVHRRLDALWQAYPVQRAAHAYSVLCTLEGTPTLDDVQRRRLLDRYAAIQAYIDEQKVASRRKDDENPFRRMTYWDAAEEAAVLQ